jgi:hypothetical protein
MLLRRRPKTTLAAAGMPALAIQPPSFFDGMPADAVRHILSFLLNSPNDLLRFAVSSKRMFAWVDSLYTMLLLPSERARLRQRVPGEMVSHARHLFLWNPASRLPAYTECVTSEEAYLRQVRLQALEEYIKLYDGLVNVTHLRSPLVRHLIATGKLTPEEAADRSAPPNMAGLTAVQVEAVDIYGLTREEVIAHANLLDSVNRFSVASYSGAATIKTNFSQLLVILAEINVALGEYDGFIIQFIRIETPIKNALRVLLVEANIPIHVLAQFFPRDPYCRSNEDPEVSVLLSYPPEFLRLALVTYSIPIGIFLSAIYNKSGSGEAYRDGFRYSVSARMDLVVEDLLQFVSTSALSSKTSIATLLQEVIALREKLEKEYKKGDQTRLDTAMFHSPIEKMVHIDALARLQTILSVYVSPGTILKFIRQMQNKALFYKQKGRTYKLIEKVKSYCIQEMLKQLPWGHQLKHQVILDKLKHPEPYFCFDVGRKEVEEGRFEREFVPNLITMNLFYRSLRKDYPELRNVPTDQFVNTAITFFTPRATRDLSSLYAPSSPSAAVAAAAAVSLSAP